uniref:Uncharacterized protein n=1 Tax=Odontella aurita TaxID=265563 RepID=A0A7S4HTP1_9STRA|mmetsp:Transcript_15088/g.43808  ORF Transcript_15088/g.43808 Transcript_15088/m.43808 type:complete len:117 (+) Transcript_15088:300-650(+)
MVNTSHENITADRLLLNDSLDLIPIEYSVATIIEDQIPEFIAAVIQRRLIQHGIPKTYWLEDLNNLDYPNHCRSPVRQLTGDEISKIWKMIQRVYTEEERRLNGEPFQFNFNDAYM